VRQIVHNGTIHGAQVRDGDQRHEPIGYYHRAGGLGDVMRTLGHPYKLGVIGLGAGASAAYLGADDEVVFYEIDPDDEALARRWFTYLDDCRGKTRVVIGDARLTLASDAEAPDGYFQAFLVDAFSGDAIPTHLLTREALELYVRKLRPGGLLLFHVTNRFYDLRPVLEAARRALGMHAAIKVRRDGELEPFELHTTYWAMSTDERSIERLVANGWTPSDTDPATARPTMLWTDDYVNVLAPLWRGVTAKQER